jgi:hypothetical protein
MPMDEEFTEDLFSNIECESCGQHYEAVRISVLRRRRGWLLSIYCPGCKRRLSAFFSVRAHEASEVVGEPTEAEKSKLSIPLGADEVIDIHIFLEDFNGDFRSLFSGGR